MSTKNFVSYSDAETLFTGVGNKISGKQAKPTTISYADWLLLTPQQQETGNWLVTGVPGADLSLRVLALETNKQDKTDNNLQTTSKETTGAINELKSGLTNVETALANLIINEVTEVTFDQYGKGTFTAPEGYKPLAASLDQSWFTTIHFENGSFYVMAHSVTDPTILITSQTVKYNWFLYFG